MKSGLSLILMSGLAVAQTSLWPSSVPAASPSLGMGSPTPLLATAKSFEVHNSYTLSYASCGSASYSQGLMLSQMSYQLARPLTLNLDIGMATPFYTSGMNSSEMSRAQFYLPRVGLDYRPTSNTLISFNYSRMPANWYYNGYGSLWGTAAWR